MSAAPASPVAGPSTSTPAPAREASNGAPKEEDAEMADGTGDSLPEEASEVLYINNLNERIKVEGALPLLS